MGKPVSISFRFVHRPHTGDMRQMVDDILRADRTWALAAWDDLKENAKRRTFLQDYDRMPQ